MTNNKVEIGKISSVHGVKGLLKIYPNLEDYSLFASFGSFFLKDGEEIKITQKFISKKIIVCEVEGVSTREAAEEMVGTLIYIDKDELPKVAEGEVYVDDLIGMQVEDKNGEAFGEVLGFYNFGAGDIIEIRLAESGKTEMLAYDEDFKIVDKKMIRLCEDL